MIYTLAIADEAKKIYIPIIDKITRKLTKIPIWKISRTIHIMHGDTSLVQMKIFTHQGRTLYRDSRRPVSSPTPNALIAEIARMTGRPPFLLTPIVRLP